MMRPANAADYARLVSSRRSGALLHLHARHRAGLRHGDRNLVEHFDSLAPEYLDAHGPAERLLAYRLAIIRRFLATARMGTLLEIGCGTAIHLLPLAGRFRQAHGIDVSPEMVRVAYRHAEVSPWRARISLRDDPAKESATVEDGSVDIVLCVGALEHMLDKPRAVRQVHRVLRVGGVFICLTPNGGYCWYRHLAPRLGLETRHLSTDRFLTASEVETLIGGGIGAPALRALAVHSPRRPSGRLGLCASGAGLGRSASPARISARWDRLFRRPQGLKSSEVVKGVFTLTRTTLCAWR